jgi:hypothetical protein
MLVLEIFALICTAIALFFFSITLVEIHFEKKEDARRAQQKAFAEQVRAWLEDPHNESLRWW